MVSEAYKNEVGYSAIHQWIRKRKPKPINCEICGLNKAQHLGNISGQYKREITDFRWVCPSCNKTKLITPNNKYAEDIENMRIKKRAKLGIQEVINQHKEYYERKKQNLCIIQKKYDEAHKLQKKQYRQEHHQEYLEYQKNYRKTHKRNK